MKKMSGCKLIAVIGGAACALLFLPGASAGGYKDHPYRHSDIDMPVSLAAGTVRTAAFPVIFESYDIILQAEKRIPFGDLQCLLGVTNGTLDFRNCSKEPVIQADWIVWDGEHIVSHGSVSGFGGAQFTNKYIFKFIGSFGGEAGKKYVLEVDFTKDGAPLNVTNPHLIVIRHKYN
jgi:hypothetical protein